MPDSIEKRNLRELPIEQLIRVADILIEAMPFIREFRGSIVVVKYGGAAMVRPELKEAVIRDIVLMSDVGVRPIVVHGGGPEITALMKRLGIEPQFVDGQRVTDAETLRVAEMTLVGGVNMDLPTGSTTSADRPSGFRGRTPGCSSPRNSKTSTRKGAPKAISAMWAASSA